MKSNQTASKHIICKQNKIPYFCKTNSTKFKRFFLKQRNL